MRIRVEERAGAEVHVYLEGAVTFLRLASLATAFEAIAPRARVHIHLELISITLDLNG